MNDLFVLFYTFADAIVWIIALVFLVSVAHRKDRRWIGNTFVKSALFSITVLFSMSDPIILPNGAGIYDMRYLLIGVATALFGPLVGGITLVTAMTFRVYVGGVGVEAALYGTVTVYSLCWLYHHFVAGMKIPMLKKSAILGLLVSGQLVAFIAVPQPMRWGLFAELAPYMVISSFVGAFLLNHLLSGEFSFLSHTQRLKIAANTDHLTGLVNRRGLELLYPNLAAPGGQGKGQAVICFDVDRFKVMNDRYGHAAGDQLLQHIVNLVASSLRRNDTFVRLGGDEFAVVLPDIREDEAHVIAERCREVVANTDAKIGVDVVRTSISVGAVWLNQPAALPVMLLHADDALYAAKAKGRNAVEFFGALTLGGTGGGGADWGAPA